MRAAIFLDRDGVINHDPGDYTKHLSEFHVLPTVMEALKALTEKGFELVLITNQGGIAKGLYAHEDVEEIHREFNKLCVENGTPILDIYYSPHHPNHGESLSRKPGSLMIERACARYNIDPRRSWMVGDKERDLEAGRGAGVRGHLLPVNGDLLAAAAHLTFTPESEGHV
jgi:D-glycero-D-manno-heptose 1,7-bisphosphate phosphatase